MAYPLHIFFKIGKICYKISIKKKSIVNDVIPVFKPLIQDCDISAASRSLKEGWLGMGKDVNNFELAIKNICNLKKENL